MGSCVKDSGSFNKTTILINASQTKSIKVLKQGKNCGFVGALSCWWGNYSSHLNGVTGNLTKDVSCKYSPKISYQHPKMLPEGPSSMHSFLVHFEHHIGTPVAKVGGSKAPAKDPHDVHNSRK